MGGPLCGKAIAGQHVWLDEGNGQTKQLTVHQLLPVTPRCGDRDMPNLMKYTSPYLVLTATASETCLSEFLIEFDPRCRTEPFTEAVKAQINGTEKRRVFLVVARRAVHPGANVMKKRFVLMLKSAGSCDPN